MAIVGSAWSSTLYGTLSGMGMNGQRLHRFTDAVGNGSQMSVVGKPFTTTDIGLVESPGVGAGVGVVGISAGDVTNAIYGNCQAIGFTGARLHDLCTAIGSALVSNIAQATLISTHGKVFQGAGTVVVGSIGVNSDEWGSNIHASAPDFIGNRWSDFANAIGQGSASQVIASGTGVVAITGSYTGPYPPGPIPGTGVGAGTIS